MNRLLAAALIPLVALPGPALADGFCRHATVGYGHVTYTPTYASTPTYSVPYADPYAVVVGRAFPVYLPLSSYTSVADEQREYLKQKNAVRDGFLEALQIANQGGGGVTPPAPAPSPTPAPPVVPPLGTPPSIPKASAPKGAAPRFTSLQAIMQGRCASCHNPKEPKRLDLSGDVNAMPCAVLGYCQTKVTDGSMPRNGELPQAEFDLFTSEVAKRMAAELAKSTK